MSLLNNEEDEYLVELYSSGEEDALRILIERYTPKLYNFIKRFSRDNTNDLVQEVFIKVWKNIKNFDSSRASFKTWIFTIARNTITDYLRKTKTISGDQKILSFSDFDKGEGSFIETIPDESILPNELLEKLEDTELLNSLLSKLPDQYREVLVLYYQEEMTFDEVGKVLNKPLNTVKSHHRRALEQLRKMVL